MSLCDACGNFDLQSFRAAPYQTRGYRLADAEHGATSQNCEFCELVYGIALELLSKQTTDSAKKLQWIHLRMSQNADPRRSKRSEPLCFNRMDVVMSDRNALFTSGQSGEKAWQQEGVHCRVLADPESTAFKSGDITGAYLGPDRASEYHFSTISTWLGNCSLRHSRCNKTVSGVDIDAMRVRLPTRCIEIGPRCVKLKETADLKGAYITLSHRWSSRTGLSRTTTSNLSARLYDIAPETLSQTFQDAITVTRRLGVPYLWIDSLCIIQAGDEGQDWKREAIRMSEYYQHSVLTIAAHVDAKNDGFLYSPAADVKEKLVRLPYRNMKGERKGFIYLHRYRGLLGASSAYGSYVLDGELLTRGWVLQEWFLSRRLLHYTKHQMFLECQTSEPFNDLNETVRCEDLAKLRINGRRAVGQEIFSLHKLAPDGSQSPRETWHHLVQFYSGSDLTKPESDRIVAISGVAKEVRAIMSSSNSHSPGEHRSDEDQAREFPYVAGLWMRDLHVSLLWEQRDDKALTQSSCGAPTWSWAAWLNPVHWRESSSTVDTAFRIVSSSSNNEDHAPGGEEPDRLTNQIFNVDNSFVRLVLHGKAGLVLVGTKPDKSTCTKLARYTGIRAEMTSRWVCLSDPDNPSELVGWANIDSHRNLVGLTQKPARQIWPALHVSTYKCSSGGLQFGNLGFSHDVYCALLMTPIAQAATGRPRYVRAGVVRIFKKDFFLDTKDVDIELV